MPRKRPEAEKPIKVDPSDLAEFNAYIANPTQQTLEAYKAAYAKCEAEIRERMTRLGAMKCGRSYLPIPIDSPVRAFNPTFTVGTP